MTDETTSPLKLSREDMYELVWSKPMRDLAKDFGISDVALAKRCKSLGIPVPGRGYWARVDAGQAPHKPKLPKRERDWGDDHALTVPAAPAATGENDATAGNEDDPAVDAVDTIQTQIVAIRLAAIPSILQIHPAAKRTARELKHPRRSELTFDRGEKTGPLIRIEVSTESLDRALLLADLLLRASESLGWNFVDVPPKQSGPAPRRYGYQQPEASSPAPKKFGELLIAGERVAFSIEERYRDEPRTPTTRSSRVKSGSTATRHRVRWPSRPETSAWFGWIRTALGAAPPGRAGTTAGIPKLSSTCLTSCWVSTSWRGQ